MHRGEMEGRGSDGYGEVGARLQKADGRSLDAETEEDAAGRHHEIRWAEGEKNGLERDSGSGCREKEGGRGSASQTYSRQG